MVKKVNKDHKTATVKKKVRIERLPSGRAIFPDKLKLWGLIQADDFGQWIAAEVKAQTRHEAIFIFNKHYGYPDCKGLLEGYTLTGRTYDKYLRIVELGGETLEYVQRMKPHEVRETVGLYELE